MADRRVDGAGCLGRVLTLLGVVWLGVVVIAGLFGLRDNAGSLAALIGSTVPALVLLAVGRTLSRHAAERREAPSLPQPTTPATGPTPQMELPRPRPAPPPPLPTEVHPKPARPSPTPEPDVPSAPPPPPVPSLPKSSKEMIDEARKRWGKRPQIP